MFLKYSLTKKEIEETDELGIDKTLEAKSLASEDMGDCGREWRLASTMLSTVYSSSNVSTCLQPLFEPFDCRFP